MRSRILAILSTIALCSCTMSDFDMDEVTPPDFNGIAGKISDEGGYPIEHIKVTVDIEGMEPTTAYTSSEGIFIISLDDSYLEIDQVEILIEDIDGEDFGGHYATLRDIVRIDEYQESGFRLSLDYRLTPATASEYSPQF